MCDAKKKNIAKENNGARFLNKMAAPIAANKEIIGHRPGYISPQQLKVILKMLMDEDTGQ